MATKEQPGDYDCYANAEPDEPMFVLLARDPTAPSVIANWVAGRIVSGKNRVSDDQIAEALACADAMEAWRAERRA